jgi:hypothetical protein
MTMRMLMFLVAALGVLAAPAGAEPFWITYEGNDFPENEGWERITYNGEANRWIEDGALVIDSLHDPHVEDLAKMERWMDPEAGELFVAEWRLLVEAASTGYDAGVAIARSFLPGFVSFGFGPDQAWNGLDNLFFDIEPEVFHTYRFESYDMVQFDFFIDDELLQEGNFHAPSSNQSYINFGDKTDGWASLSRWDYLRYGVVPEPPGSLMSLTGLCLTIRRAHTRCRRR